MEPNIKMCPFCGKGFRTNCRGAYEHDNEDCLLHGLKIRDAKQLEAWNTRKPIEDINSKLRKLVDTFAAANSMNVAKGVERAIKVINDMT